MDEVAEEGEDAVGLVEDVDDHLGEAVVLGGVRGFRDGLDDPEVVHDQVHELLVPREAVHEVVLLPHDALPPGGRQQRELGEHFRGAEAPPGHKRDGRYVVPLPDAVGVVTP